LAFKGNIPGLVLCALLDFFETGRALAVIRTIFVRNAKGIFATHLVLARISRYALLVFFIGCGARRASVASWHPSFAVRAFFYLIITASTPIHTIDSEQAKRFLAAGAVAILIAVLTPWRTTFFAVFAHHLETSSALCGSQVVARFTHPNTSAIVLFVPLVFDGETAQG
jgi:hypothetical protein